MSKVMWCATLIAYLLFFLPGRADAADRRGGFLSVLHKGDTVSITEAGGAYELSVIPGVEQQYKVVEVGQDYIELSGPSATLRIPIYAIRSVKTMKVGR